MVLQLLAAVMSDMVVRRGDDFYEVMILNGSGDAGAIGATLSGLAGVGMVSYTPMPADGGMPAGGASPRIYPFTCGQRGASPMIRR